MMVKLLKKFWRNSKFAYNFRHCETTWEKVKNQKKYFFLQFESWNIRNLIKKIIIADNKETLKTFLRNCAVSASFGTAKF